MKKFAKICLLIAAVFVLLGAILLGSGLAIGGTAAASDAMSAVREHSNGLWGIRFFNRHIYVTPDDEDDTSEDDFFDDDPIDDDWDTDHDNHTDSEDGHDDSDHDHGEGEADHSWSGFHSTTMEDHHSYEFDYSSLAYLEIDLNAADLTIESSRNADKLCIIADYKTFSDTVLLEENGKDSIRLIAEDKHLVGDPSMKLTIQVPENFSIEKFEIDLAAGNINSSATLNVGELDVSVNAGNLTICDLTATKADIEVDAGNTEVTLPGSLTDYNYDLSCSLGRIELDGKSKNGVDKDYVKDNQADRDISIDCATGNISVYFR